jgi:hypothetical protein
MAHIAEHRGTNRAEPAASADAFGKLIVKLRWIGAEEEADRLEDALMKFAPQGFVMLKNRETD